MVYLKYVENVIPLSKSIGLLFLFCLPLLSIFFLKTKRNDLARPVMGTIFLVISMLHYFKLCCDFGWLIFLIILTLIFPPLMLLEGTKFSDFNIFYNF